MNFYSADDICAALELGDVDILTEIETLGCFGFPGGRDPLSNRHWLTNAIDFGDLKAIRWMISRGVEVNYRDVEGATPMHSAVERERPDKYDVVNALLKAGADVNIYGRGGCTPLHYAVECNDKRLCLQLLEAGADLSARTQIDFLETPEQTARRCGPRKLADFLEKYRRYGNSSRGR